MNWRRGQLPGPAANERASNAHAVRRTPGHTLAGHPDQAARTPTQYLCSAQPSFSLPIVQLAATASMATAPAVACDRLRSAGVRLKPGLCLHADVGGRHSRDRQAEREAASLARHGSSMEQGKVRMVKTRLARWVSRWRERRLAREQTRQAPEAQQAKRDAEAQRYHSTGHGP
jgi:hypothetical protein